MKGKLQQLQSTWADAHEKLSELETKRDSEIAAIQAKYLAELAELKAAALSARDAVIQFVDHEKAERSTSELPHPEGTKLVEWMNAKKESFYDQWKSVEPYKTGREGFLHVLRAGMDLQPCEWASGIVGAKIVIIAKKNGKPGKQYVNFETQKWLPEGEDWNGE